MIAFDTFRTFGNRNEHSTKQAYTVSLQPYYVSTLAYLGKLKIAQNVRRLTAVRSVEPVVPTFRRKSFMFRSFLFLFVRKFF